MMTSMGQYIQGLRKAHKFSQQDVAKKLKLSRPTYIQIENNNREISLEDAKQLAALFNLSIDDFIRQISPSEISVTIVKDKKFVQNEKPTLRINVPQRNIKKLKEVLLYILEKVGSKSNVGMTVLYKLLYFIDFDFYEKYEEQLIGATYIKNHFGPTPVEFKKVIDDMKKKDEIEEVKSHYFKYDQTKYLPHRKADLSVLTAIEKELIDDVLMRLSDKTAKELSDYSHKDVPWLTTEVNQPIDYESVFYRTEQTSVRPYSED